MPKKTGTYADALAAVGMADLAKEITGNERARVRLYEDGDTYRITVRPDLTEMHLRAWEPGPGYLFVKWREDDNRAEAAVDYFDYPRQREIERVWRAYQNGLDRRRRRAADRAPDENVPPEPDRDLRLVKTLSAMRMGSDAYNNLHRVLDGAEGVRRIVGARLEILPGEEETLDGAARAASVLQLFNPVSGKGIHRAKPDGTGLGGFPDALIDWFDEWMKYRAIWRAMLPYQTGADGKDIKVYVLSPGDIDLGALESIRRALQKEPIFGKSVGLDIKAVLTLTRVLIENSTEYQSGGILGCPRRPNAVIKGIFSTYFKNLGNASAVMNVSFLGLPGWFEVKNREGAQNWLDLLHEHARCLQSLDESHSDDVAILLAYRDFISSGSAADMFEFYARYAAHFMHRKAQGKWVEPFTTLNMGRLLEMGYDFGPIINDPGFRAVATAIRKSTINPQMRKSMGHKPPFEIRYGLAQDWKRKARYPEQFIAELCDFVQRYNAENARNMELGRETRKPVTTEELDKVMALVRERGSETICMLLLAYGYARDAADKAEEPAAETANA